VAPGRRFSFSLACWLVQRLSGLVLSSRKQFGTKRITN
jgi:hypothetical protein